MTEPKQDAWEVIAGTDLDETYYIWDSNTGDFVDWTAGTFQAEANIRNRSGHLLARIANFGTRDGEITLIAGGQLHVNLPAAITAVLPLTRMYINSTDPRIATWRHRGVHPFDLIVTEVVNNDVSGLVQGLLTVHQSVTA